VKEFSVAEARRLALSAQGFSGTQPVKPNKQHLAATIEKMGVLQLDSVNVFSRSHYMPLFSRLGPYDLQTLDDLVLDQTTHPTHVEYWAHVAAFIPVESWPLWGWAMREAHEKFKRPGHWMHDHRQFATSLLERLRHEGPKTFSQLEEERTRKRGSWWDWSDVKLALEYLFHSGEVTVAGRRNFQRVYAATDQVIPTEILAKKINKPGAWRELILKAVSALGVAAIPEIADYFRLNQTEVGKLVKEMESEGLLEPVRVKGWEVKGKPAPAWVIPGTVPPARHSGRSTLLTPFDPITWHRERAFRLFGFDYRIEIYVPAPKRVYGYYSLPILMDDMIVGRMDLKADRQKKTLIVKSAHWEELKPKDALERLVQVVRKTADWRGLEQVTVDDWGDAAKELRKVF